MFKGNTRAYKNIAETVLSQKLAEAPMLNFIFMPNLLF